MGTDQGLGGYDAGLDIVHVPVPKRLLPAVYELLARSMNERGAQEVVNVHGSLGPEEVTCIRCRGSALRIGDLGYQCESCGLAFRDEAAGVRVDRDNGLWTRRMVGALRRELSDRPLLIDVLDNIAKVAPEAVSSDELLTRLGADPSQVRAELAVLSKASRRLFGKKIWPMSSKQGWGTGDRMGYRMIPQIAEWWSEAS